MYGLTMRNYKEVVQQFVDAYGLEKSTVIEHFVEASRVKLEQLLSRSLSGLSLCAIFIDGTIFKGEHLIVAIGLDRFGRKITHHSRILGRGFSIGAFCPSITT